jgi:hypothetical protein
MVLTQFGTSYRIIYNKGQAELKSQLLEYCKVDTFAMMKLYNFLRQT